jgi:glycosyltransferase involved in cell wall biosynthesis
MKVLVSAYACEPERGSEPGSGWNWVCQIGRFEECWAITRINNRESIEKALNAHPMPRVHFVYYDLPRWMRFWKKGQRGVFIYYYLWQIGAYLLAKKLFRKVRFDLVHHVTFGSYWRPSFLPLLPAPFLWGPVGGAESAPSSFHRSSSLRGTFYELARSAARYLAEFDPFVRMTARRAAAGLAVTPETALRLKALGCRDVSLSATVALTSEDLSILSRTPFRNEARFRILSLGRYLHWKGFELGLRAFAEFHREHPNSEYWLIGDGPERERWERMAKTLGIENNTVFWHTLPRSQVLEKIAECDVLMHPSLHDSGGWATLEAMAAGRPVICLDLGGPALQVSEATGIKIPAISPPQVVADLASALKQLAGDPSRRARLGEAARAVMQEKYNWDRKGEQLAEVYARLMKQRTLEFEEPDSVGHLAQLMKDND